MCTVTKTKATLNIIGLYFRLPKEGYLGQNFQLLWNNTDFKKETTETAFSEEGLTAKLAMSKPETTTLSAW